MHQMLGAHHLSAKGLPDGLVAKTYAQDGRLPCHVANKRDKNAGFMRRAGARRKRRNAFRPECFDLLNSQLVVAVDFDLRTLLAQILDEVVE